jgi:hypothetical protein
VLFIVQEYSYLDEFDEEHLPILFEIYVLSWIECFPRLIVSISRHCVDLTLTNTTESFEYIFESSGFNITCG